MVGEETIICRKLSLFVKKPSAQFVNLFLFRLVVLTVVLAGVELDGGEDCQVLSFAPYGD